MSGDGLRHEKLSEYDFCARCHERWPCSAMEDAADLAAANATIAAQSLTLATMREACIEEVGPNHDEVQCSICLACWPIPGLPRHEEDCFLAQPADDAATLAGSVLEAADRMAEAIRSGVRELPRGGSTGGGDPNRTGQDLIESLKAYRRARAALRGHGAVETS